MKRNDFILIGAILLISIVIILFIYINKKEGSVLVITIDGKVYKTMDLKEDTTFTIKLDNGDWNTFQIKNGKVDMTDADCPDKLCVKHKSIHYNNESIICLPHKVVLQIKGGGENTLDAVSG